MHEIIDNCLRLRTIQRLEIAEEIGQSLHSPLIQRRHSGNFNTWVSRTCGRDLPGCEEFISNEIKAFLASEINKLEARFHFLGHESARFSFDEALGKWQTSSFDSMKASTKKLVISEYAQAGNESSAVKALRGMSLTVSKISET